MTATLTTALEMELALIVILNARRTIAPRMTDAAAKERVMRATSSIPTTVPRASRELLELAPVKAFAPHAKRALAALRLVHHAIAVHPFTVMTEYVCSVPLVVPRATLLLRLPVLPAMIIILRMAATA